jgi:hypothetical protein
MPFARRPSSPPKPQVEKHLRLFLRTGNGRALFSALWRIPTTPRRGIATTAIRLTCSDRSSS